MSRQARCIGCEEAKPAVPLIPISVSMAPMHNSVAREWSRMARARSFRDGGIGDCATSIARRMSNSAASRSAAARANRTWMLVISMRVQRAARALALAQIRQPDHKALGHEDIVADRGVAAGRPHRDGEPGIDHFVVRRPDEKERRFRTAVDLEQGGDDNPSAVVDAAGERKLTRDPVSARRRRDPTDRLERSRNGVVQSTGPDRLLCLFGKLTDVMRMMDHQAGAPAMRGVGLADFAHHLEPGVETEAIAAEPRRDEYAGDACGE
jgi:hypothetical protein